MIASQEQLGSWGRVGIVLAGVLLVWLACAAVGFELNGLAGIGAASAAALVFAVCGSVSQAIGDRLQQQGKALAALGVGMALRTGVPLAIGLFWKVTDSVLAQAGVVYYLLAFYLVTLAVETVLAVSQLRRIAPHH